jgi:hypothetical protein
MFRARAAVLVAVLGLAAGCGGRMGQVDGKVVWADGGPATELEGSEVVFESAALGLSARGTVGPDGTFRLRTEQPDDGAPVGDYRVAVAENQRNANPEGTLLHPPVLDQKYRDFKTSGLTATVSPGVTPVTLTVTKAVGAKKR